MNKRYRLRFHDETYIYRPLTIGEFREVSLIEDTFEKEARILAFGLVSPGTAHGDLPSGLAEALVVLISKVTDITEDRIIQEISHARDRLGITDNILTWKVEIIKHLHYTPRQVDAMTLEEFMDAIALVEVVNGGQPLVAASREDEPAPAADTLEGPEPVVDVPDMKDISHMENVAAQNAENLRHIYRRTKKSG